MKLKGKNISDETINDLIEHKLISEIPDLFELKEVRISTAIIKENTPPMNVYFFRYEKI